MVNWMVKNPQILQLNVKWPCVGSPLGKILPKKTNDNNIPQLLGLSSKNVFSVIKQLDLQPFFVAFTIGTNN
jgi:hypothetical protein